MRQSLSSLAPPPISLLTPPPNKGGSQQGGPSSTSSSFSSILPGQAATQPHPRTASSPYQYDASNATGSSSAIPWSASFDGRLPATLKAYEGNVASSSASSSVSPSSAAFPGNLRPSRSAAHFDAARLSKQQRQAIAALSLSPGPDEQDPHSPQSTHPFMAYYSPPPQRRAVRPVKTASQRRHDLSSLSSSFGDTTSPQESLDSSFGSVRRPSCPTSPSSPSMSPTVLPFKLAEEVEEEGAATSGGVAASPKFRRRSNSNVDQAVHDMGWYWDSDATRIWQYSRRPSSHRATSVPADALLATGPSQGPSSPTSSESPSSASPQASSWSTFVEAYSRGDLDLDAVNDIRPFASGKFEAPIPPFEHARKMMACRLGVFTPAPSLTKHIDTLKRTVAEKLDLSHDEMMVDVLYGEEGWEFIERGLVHHNNFRRETICAHLILNRNKGLTVDDLHSDWRFKDSAMLQPFVTFCGQPITTSSGLPLGGFCAILDKDKRVWTTEDKALLKLAAEQVSHLLENAFAEAFHNKMTRMSATFYKVQSSLQMLHPSRLPACDALTGEVKVVNQGDAIFRALSTSGERALCLDECCHRVASALDLEAVFILASPSAAILARSHRRCPLNGDKTALAAMQKDCEAEEDQGCVVYQNSLDGKTFPPLPRPDDASGLPYSCGLAMPLPTGQTSFILVTATTKARHVIGIEDLRLLQCLRPHFESTLKRCLQRDVSRRDSAPVAGVVAQEEALPNAVPPSHTPERVPERKASLVQDDPAPRRTSDTPSLKQKNESSSLRFLSAPLRMMSRKTSTSNAHGNGHNEAMVAGSSLGRIVSPLARRTSQRPTGVGQTIEEDRQPSSASSLQSRDGSDDSASHGAPPTSEPTSADSSFSQQSATHSSRFASYKSRLGARRLCSELSVMGNHSHNVSDDMLHHHFRLQSPDPLTSTSMRPSPSHQDLSAMPSEFWMPSTGSLTGSQPLASVPMPGSNRRPSPPYLQRSLTDAMTLSSSKDSQVVSSPPSPLPLAQKGKTNRLGLPAVPRSRTSVTEHPAEAKDYFEKDEPSLR